MYNDGGKIYCPMAGQFRGVDRNIMCPTSLFNINIITIIIIIIYAIYGHVYINGIRLM